MPYLIDGHNLIPHVPGLSLSELDDEMRLVELLQAFCRQRRKRVDVYFDKAPPGVPVQRKFGPVTAYFVREGMIADDAIRLRLRALGRTARNWTVVSSDHQVQAEARAAHAQVLPSGSFAEMLVQGTGEEPPSRTGSEAPRPDIQEWLDLFGGENGVDKLE